MRRHFLIPLLLILLLTLGAAGVQAQPTEVVVMVDVSQSMFGVFEDLLSYLLSDLLLTVTPGDGFHLLTFADSPAHELSQTIRGGESVGTIVTTLMLLDSLGQYTDLVAALQFLHEFARDLPDPSARKIFLLTDGIHDPPPGSSHDMTPAEVQAALFETSRQIDQEGWAIRILRLPGRPAAGTPAAGTMSSSTGVASDKSVPSGSADRAETYLGRIAEWTDAEISDLPRTDSKPVEIGASSEEGPPPSSATEAPPTETDAGRPSNGDARLPRSPSDVRVVRAFFIVLLGLLLIGLLAAVIAVFRSRGGTQRLPRPRFKDRGSRTGDDLVEMLVSMQNSRIGLRNVHRLSAGTSRSVGGGCSAYLIYFVPVARSIARITYDGSSYRLRIRRPEYFPGVPADLRDCLDTWIPAVSARGYAFSILFRRYRSPLREINRLMRSIGHSDASGS